MLYLLVALGMGLFISSTLKSQFLASQITQLVTFLPATMLSGFIYDLRSVPAVHPGASATACRRAISWPCCRPSSWPATSGA